MERFRSLWEEIRSRKWFPLARIMAVCAAALILILLLILLSQHVSRSYEVIDRKLQDGLSATSRYGEVEGMLLRYSGDGATLLNDSFSPIWNTSFNMGSPELAVNGQTAVLFDRNANDLMVFDLDGEIGRFRTPEPIVKAVVSKKGLTAVILSKDGRSAIRYYDTDGTEIASVNASISDTGIPFDLDLSDNGERMIVSYVTFAGGTVGSRIVIYHFGKTGQDLLDHVIYNKGYSDILIPDVEFLNDKTAVALTENGFFTLNGTDSVTEEEGAAFSEEIVSAFFGDESVGLVFAGKEEGIPFRLCIYRPSGRLIREADLGFYYETIRATKDEIVAFNTSEMAIYSDGGILRYEGPMEEGGLSEIVKVRRNRYLLMTDTGGELIKRKW